MQLVGTGEVIGTSRSHGVLLQPFEHMGFLLRHPHSRLSSINASSDIMLLSHTGSNVKMTFTAYTPLTLATCPLTSSTSMSAIGQLGAVSVMRMLAVPSGV